MDERTDGWTDGQRENSIPTHKHSLLNKYARFDEIPSMTLKDIKETKRYGWTDGQRENSIPTHKHSLRGYNNTSQAYWL